MFILPWSPPLYLPSQYICYILAPELSKTSLHLGSGLIKARLSQLLPISSLPLPALSPSPNASLHSQLLELFLAFDFFQWLSTASSIKSKHCSLSFKASLTGSNSLCQPPLPFLFHSLWLLQTSFSSLQTFAQAVLSAKNALRSIHCVSKTLPSQICLLHQPFALNMFHLTHKYVLITSPNISEPTFLCAK